jgi:hypothetical protein
VITHPLRRAHSIAIARSILALLTVLLPWPDDLFSVTEHQPSIYRIMLHSQPIMHVLAINFPFGSISTDIEAFQHASKQHFWLVVWMLAFFLIELAKTSDFVKAAAGIRVSFLKRSKNVIDFLVGTTSNSHQSTSLACLNIKETLGINLLLKCVHCQPKLLLITVQHLSLEGTPLAG